MLLYHGSPSIVSQPKYGYGSLRNDYGRGFYCTEDIDLAREWACLRGSNGYVNQYTLETPELSILDLNGGDYHILNWLAILTRHRSYWERASISEEAKSYLQSHFYVDISRFDVIKGYRADDSYFSFAQAFVANGITLDQLRRAMKLGELGEQIVLISQKAFGSIRFINSEPVSFDQYYEKAIERDCQARRSYRNMVRSEKLTEGVLMADIIRERWTNDDTRLR